MKTQRLLLLFSLLVGSLDTFSQSNQVADNIEFQALKDLWDSTGGSGWTTKTNWPAAGNWPSSATAAQMGTWYGITVTNGDITSIVLNTNHLVGKLPSSVDQLTKLITLKLSSNQLSGPIPTQIGNLSHLSYLYLDYNQFSGTVPSSIGNLTALGYLVLNNNQLSGTFPDVLNNMTGLGYFIINNNQFSGPLPATLGNATGLYNFTASSNKFSGTLPTTYANLTNMRYLYLDVNEISGQLPSFIGNWTTLFSLVIANNKFSGVIPSSISNLTTLSYLDVSNNQFTGSFPAMGSTIIGYIYCTNNYLTSVPASLLLRPNLVKVYFNNNEITSIPNFGTYAGKGNLVLYLNNNHLDFSQLEPLTGFKAGTVIVPQKNVVDQLTQVMTIGSSLVLTARPVGTNTSITWEKQNANGGWASISSSDQDAMQQAYTRNSAVMTDAGVYRWKSTSTSFPGTAIMSDPIAVKTASGFTCDNWCFQYKYDARKRMTHKKAPGADWVYMVYDRRDRLVMTQDGNQRLNNQWTFTRYDALNRPIMTGLYNHGILVDQAGMTALVDSAGVFFETYNNTHAFFGYTNTMMPAATFPGTLEPLTVTYYDTYDFVHADAYFSYRSTELQGQYNYGQATAFINTIGQVTGSWTRVLGADRQWMRTVNYYDDKGRLVQSVADNHKRGLDVTTSVYDFTGQVITNKTRLTEHKVQWGSVASSIVVGEDRLTLAANLNTQAAFSSQQIAENEDGWVEFTCSSNKGTSSYRYVGLSSGTPASIGYQVFQSRLGATSTIQVAENGIAKSPAFSVEGGDVIRIERRGMTMYYTKNGVVIWQTTLTSRPALTPHVQMSTIGSEVFNPRVSLSGTTHTIERQFEYDHAGRLINTWHGVDGQALVLLSKNEYNELGQLVDKKLHSSDTTHFRQSLDYRYNIRGWLTSINGAQLASDNYKNPDANERRDLFGIDLLYNNVDGGLGNVAFHNGNISAMKWSDNLGLGNTKETAYRFDYDSMNRLKSATQKAFRATWAPSSAYQESGVTYDLNGNIKTLLRTDGNGALMDSLKYGYGKGDVNSNMLRAVTDKGTTQGFSDAPGVGDDYVYDNNGNMTSDKNKSITAITYNNLNLPVKVTKSTGDYLSYIYDATGRKLIQYVCGPTNVIKKTSYYLGEWFYENDTLKFINNEEGRVIMTGSTPEYQYHLKDHLGNVRMTFTTKDDVDEAMADFETASADFLYYDEAVKVNSTIFDHTGGESTHYSARLNGTRDERYGLAKSLSVMAGDTINAQVFVKYLDPDTAATVDLAAFFNSIADHTAPASTFKDGGLLGSTGGVIPFGAMFTEVPENDNEDAPKAYLNWLIFDRDYTLKDLGALQISTAAAEHGENGAHEELSKQIIIKEAGYVYVYLSNDNLEMNNEVVEVYFDDFEVERVKSPVIESQSYYPFGLTFNSYSRENSLANQYKFQGQEHQDELDLGWDSFKWRNDMPDIGRFFNVDALSEKYYHNSPYAFSENHVTTHIELEGLEKVEFMAALFKPHEMVGHKVDLGGTIVTKEEEVNKNFKEITQYAGQSMMSTIDTGTGEQSGISTIESPRVSSIANQMWDELANGGADYFDHELSTEKTENGSTITGQIEGTKFTINVGVTEGNLTFDATIKGGDTDKAFAIKVNGITISFGQGGRDKNGEIKSRAVVPYKMDNNGKVSIDANYSLKASEDDRNTDTRITN